VESWLVFFSSPPSPTPPHPPPPPDAGRGRYFGGSSLMNILPNT
jgi:hypothetical protein